MSEVLSNSARKVQELLAANGFDNKVVELPQSTRSAVEAAQAIGCEVCQIVKSVIFKSKTSGDAILVVASGTNRVDEKKVAEAALEPIGKADADFVRDKTGFVIGGVPPFGHIQPIKTFVDEELLQHGEIWAAAGTPNAVFRLKPSELVQMTKGTVLAVKQS